MRYVSQHLVNCRNKFYDKSTKNRMELDGNSCSKQPRLVDCRVSVVNKLDRRRRRRRVGDNAIYLPRRNFLCPEFGAVPEGSIPIFEDTQISLKHTVG